MRGVRVPSRSMSTTLRNALLIRCSEIEADRIRSAARAEDRTMSGYVLHVLKKAWPIEERLRENLDMVRNLNLRVPGDASVTGPSEKVRGPRTALLIRCSADEASRIRAAARRKHMTLNSYVLDALSRNWRVHEHLHERLEQFRKGRLGTTAAVKMNAEREWQAKPKRGLGRKRSSKTSRMSR